MVRKFAKIPKNSENQNENGKIKRKKNSKVPERIIPEQNRFICGTICVCQMLFMFSCVAILYLSGETFFVSRVTCHMVACNI